MAKLTIIRPNEWANQAKEINIYIDGIKAGAVGINHTIEIEVLSGKHKVELKSRWGGGSKPLAIDLKDKENKTFKISSNQYTILFLPLLFIIASTIYHGATSIFESQPSFLSTIAGIGLINILLFIPFYSKYFMRLKEVVADVPKKITKEEEARLIRN